MRDMHNAIVRMRLLLLAVIGLIAAAVAFPACSSPLGTDRYDHDIEHAAERFLPGWDWHWLKAQYYQESALDPAAISPAGARGIAQIMPGTWREIAPTLGVGGASPHAAGPAILAGAAYMARMRRTWSAARPESDRRELAQASYNAGAGSVLRAQRACNGARHWPEISACLPAVTGSHAAETITYVDRIKGWYWILRT